MTGPKAMFNHSSSTIFDHSSWNRRFASTPANHSPLSRSYYSLGFHTPELLRLRCTLISIGGWSFRWGQVVIGLLALCLFSTQSEVEIQIVAGTMGAVLADRRSASS